MTKNIFPRFLQEAISYNFADVGATAVMLDMEKLTPHLQLERYNYSSDEIFTSSELQVLHSYTFKKRRYEWLTGRICAKMAVADFVSQRCGNHLQMKQIVVENMPSGRPYIVCPDLGLSHDDCDISISHSGRYALAVAATAPCGVDIQEPRQTLVRVKNRFCLEEEEVLLHKVMAEHSQIPPLTLLWAAKEAVRKAYSLQLIPEFLQLKLSSAKTDSRGWLRITFSHSQINPTVVCGFFKRYGVAICITGGQSNA